MADEPVVAPVKKVRPRTTKPKADDRIIGAHVIEKEAAPADQQKIWLDWYDSHNAHDKAVIDDTMYHILYSTTGVGYRVMVHTYQEWLKRGIVGATKKTTRF